MYFEVILSIPYQMLRLDIHWKRWNFFILQARLMCLTADSTQIPSHRPAFSSKDFACQATGVAFRNVYSSAHVSTLNANDVGPSKIRAHRETNSANESNARVRCRNIRSNLSQRTEVSRQEHHMLYHISSIVTLLPTAWMRDRLTLLHSKAGTIRHDGWDWWPWVMGVNRYGCPAWAWLSGRRHCDKRLS